MSIDKSITTLSNYYEFFEFIEGIHADRESAIQNLHGVNSDSVQQIAGQILAFDSILSQVDRDLLVSRHRKA